MFKVVPLPGVEEGDRLPLVSGDDVEFIVKTDKAKAAASATTTPCSRRVEDFSLPRLADGFSSVL